MRPGSPRSIAAAVNWLLDSGTQDAYLATVLGRTVRVAQRHAAPQREPGLVIVQLDGVGPRPAPAGAARRCRPDAVALAARRHPSRLPLAHRPSRDHARAGRRSCCTATCTIVPSFRWYEKQSGKLIVANRPADAAVIDNVASRPARGLLAAWRGQRLEPVLAATRRPASSP